MPSLSLAADGGVTISNPEGPDLTGMVSPSAKLLVAVAADPEISEITKGESEIFISGLDEAVSEWLVGVKTTNTPQVTGKTYRVLRKDWWMEGPVFEIDFSGLQDRLVFNANGTSVTRTFDSGFEAIDFDGDFDSDTSSEPLPLAVDVQGRITLEGTIPDDYTTRAFGYSQEGRSLLVMVKTGETVDGAAGVGLIIAVREP